MKVLFEAPQAAEPLLAATDGLYANRADAEDQTLDYWRSESLKRDKRERQMRRQ